MGKEVMFSGLLSEMAKYGHKQKDIAKLLDLPESAISKRFSGEIEWRIGEIEKICDYYNKDCYELGLMKKEG